MGPSETILGIDPGTNCTGYGLIQTDLCSSTAIDFGCIRPPLRLLPYQKYLIIFESIEELIKKYSPHAIVVETPFVKKNIKTAIQLGKVNATALLAGAKHRVPIFEYAPRKAKLAVVGTGSASKNQVQKMLQKILGLSSLPEPEDASDALALALCHIHERKFKKCLPI